MPSRYKLRDYQFGQCIMVLRRQAGFTQKELALQLGVSEKALRNWEAGVHYPTTANLQKLLELALHRQAFPPGQERQEAKALWDLLGQSTSRHLIFDDAWFQRLLTARPARSQSREQTHGREGAAAPLPWQGPSTAGVPATVSLLPPAPPYRYRFFGRSHDRALERW